MGSWGPKLYQDDVAEDVRDYYKELLKKGNTNEQATKEIIEKNTDVISDEDEAPIFWFALSDTQWSLGRLLPLVKETALKYLESGSNLKRWKNEAISQREYRDREKVLKELEQKLITPMPPEKKITQHKLYKCEWKIGDIFAYRLESDIAKEKGLLGRYLLIRKVDECTWWPGHIVPIVYISITKDDELPQNVDEIQQTQYIQSTFARGKTEYRTLLLSTSKRIIPTNRLKFIGNFSDLTPPRDEYIIHDKVSIVTCKWSNFEESIIEKYCIY